MALTKKDPLVIRVIRNVSEDCGVGVAGLISAFGPECVVLGGGVIEALGKTMLPIIRKTAEAHVLPGTLRGIKIIASKMGDDGGIYGAALHAQEALSNSKR
jgi:glucokinase